MVLQCIPIQWSRADHHQELDSLWKGFRGAHHHKAIVKLLQFVNILIDARAQAGELSILLSESTAGGSTDIYLAQ